MIQYTLVETENSLAVTVNLSEKMVRDLCKYSEFYGRDVQVDIRLRLARSLERDWMQEQIHNQSGMDGFNFTLKK